MAVNKTHVIADVWREMLEQPDTKQLGLSVTETTDSLIMSDMRLKYI